MNYLDLEELALAACGLDEEESEAVINGDADKDIDELLYEHFETDFDAFSKIASALLDFVPALKSELSGDYFQAFGQQWRIHIGLPWRITLTALCFAPGQAGHGFNPVGKGIKS